MMTALQEPSPEDGESMPPEHGRRWAKYPPEPGNGQHTVVGNLRVMSGFQSPQLGNERDIYLYLPPSYNQDNRRFPVIYMHDGQNLFDRATSFGEEWRVDNTMDEFSRLGIEAIVVGIANTGETRIDEYSPFRNQDGRGGKGEAYVDFIVETLKPAIDEDFRTLPERETTAIVGSSMGGLISLYAFFHRSDVFGKVGAMSPALWFAERAIFPFVAQSPHVGGRMYVGVGTGEGEKTVADAQHLRDLLIEKDYRLHRDLLYIEEPDAAHTETAWGQRLTFVVDFLMRA